MDMKCAEKAQCLFSRIFQNAHAHSITFFTPMIQLKESKSNFVGILVQFYILKLISGTSFVCIKTICAFVDTDQMVMIKTEDEMKDEGNTRT